MEDNIKNREVAAGEGRLTALLGDLIAECPDGKMDPDTLKKLIVSAIEDVRFVVPEQERMAPLYLLFLGRAADVQKININEIEEWPEEKLMDAAADKCRFTVLDTARDILACRKRKSSWPEDGENRELKRLDEQMQQMAGVLFAADSRMAEETPPLLAAVAAAAVLTAETGCSFGLDRAQEMIRQVLEACRGEIGAKLDDKALEAVQDAERAIRELRREIQAKSEAESRNDAQMEQEKAKNKQMLQNENRKIVERQRI